MKVHIISGVIVGGAQDGQHLQMKMTPIALSDVPALAGGTFHSDHPDSMGSFKIVGLRLCLELEPIHEET